MTGKEILLVFAQTPLDTVSFGDWKQSSKLHFFLIAEKQHAFSVIHCFGYSFHALVFTLLYSGLQQQKWLWQIDGPMIDYCGSLSLHAWLILSASPWWNLRGDLYNQPCLLGFIQLQEGGGWDAVLLSVTQFELSELKAQQFDAEICERSAPVFYFLCLYWSFFSRQEIIDLKH